MADERDFESWRPKYLTFREYVQGVVSNSARRDEFENLVKVFSLPVLELVLEGKRVIEAREFLKPKEAIK